MKVCLIKKCFSQLIISYFTYMFVCSEISCKQVSIINVNRFVNYINERQVSMEPLS